MKLVQLFSLLFFLVSCGNTANTVSDEKLDGSYTLMSVGGQKIGSEEIIFRFNPIGNIISGKTGCNQFSANFQQDGRELNFTTPISTRKYCEGKMATEREILSSFEEAVKFIRTGDDYIFLSEDNEQLITLTKTN